MKWNTKLKSLKDNYKKYISIYVEANYLYLIISTQSSFSVSVIADLALYYALDDPHRNVKYLYKNKSVVDILNRE